MGRLTDPSNQFSDIIVRTGSEGEITRAPRRGIAAGSRQIVDTDGKKPFIGGIELRVPGNWRTPVALSTAKCRWGWAIYQLPGSNALDTAERVRARMASLKKGFPDGVDFAIVYDTTPFISESIAEVFHTLRDAIILVAIVVLVFLQTWRATIIPLLAVPVAIIGTFAVMAGIHFSLNNLSLLGLVLAIGIVVDDAIVVVEAVEHNLEHGLSPRDATRKAMDETAGPIVAISLVLMAVFIPCAFISGITGQFFRQFAVTVAVSTFFSAVNSLTLSPALSALLLKPKAEQKDPLTWLLNLLLGWFFAIFNKVFDVGTAGYAWVVGYLLRLSLIGLVVYGGLLFLTYKAFTSVPTGFIPPQDKGYLLVDVQLPDSASLERTEAVMAAVDKIARGDSADKTNYPGIKGIAHTISIPGPCPCYRDAMARTSGPCMSSSLNFDAASRERRRRADAIADQAAVPSAIRRIDAARVAVFGAPAVRWTRVMPVASR